MEEDIDLETLPTCIVSENLEVHSTRIFLSPNMAVAGIENTFFGELGFFSEENPPWKVRLINTTVQ